MTTYSLSFLSSLVSSPLRKKRADAAVNLAVATPVTELSSIPFTKVYSCSSTSAPISPRKWNPRTTTSEKYVTRRTSEKYVPRTTTSEKYVPRRTSEKYVPRRTESPIGRQSGSGGRGRANKKNPDVKHNTKVEPSPITVSLADLIRKKQWLEALQAFEMLKEQPFYYPKELTYMKLIVLLGRCNQPHRAHQLFDEMIQQGFEPTCRRYTTVLAAYCKSHLLHEALTVFELMKIHPNSQPDTYTYNVLIKACIQANRFELIDSLHDQMAERTLIPNILTQNTILKGYAKAGKLNQLEKLVSEMMIPNAHKPKPDVITMNMIISLFGNKGDIETMEKWYDSFCNFGIQPESRTFNILIGAYVKKRLYDKMSTVLQTMKSLSIPWSTSTYNSVIEAFADAGEAENMAHTFDQMLDEGMRTDTKTFCCLIKGYANAGMFRKVVECVELAGNSGVPENTSICNAVISACAKAGDVVEMEKVFMRMKEKGRRPDCRTYELMIDAYRKVGMDDKVLYLDEEKRASSIDVSGINDDVEDDNVDDEDDDEDHEVGIENE